MRITRKRLARGTKIVPEHVFEPLKAMADGFSSRNVTQDQLAQGSGTFRVNLSIPYIATDFVTTAGDIRPYSVPFCLPPLQDFFNFEEDLNNVLRPGIGPDTPSLVLDEVSVSFDQRAEGCAIADQFHGAARAASGNSVDAAKMDFDNAPRLSLRVLIEEKEQTYFNPLSIAAGGLPQPTLPVGDEIGIMSASRVIVAVDLSSELLVGTGGVDKLNPFITTEINKAINPYRTYIMTLECAGLADGNNPPDEGLALVNILVSMRFRHPLVLPDTDNNPTELSPGVITLATQNLPTKESGTASGPSISVPAPATLYDTTILADGSNGIAYNMGIIDEEFGQGLRGGYDRNSELFPTEHLRDNSCYEVIAVPMMQNRRAGGIIADTVAAEPYMSAPPVAGDVIADRRIIPVHYPLSIHHVILAWNWSRWVPGSDPGALAATDVPASTTFKCQVGVGIGTGLSSDDYTYTQVAYHEMLSPRQGRVTAALFPLWESRIIDRVKTQYLSPGRGSTPAQSWDWELHSIPINYVGAVGSSGGGAGYMFKYRDPTTPANVYLDVIGGDPFFVGTAWKGPVGTTTASRSNVNNVGFPVVGVAGAPATGGAEQFLEVRMGLSDAGVLDVAGAGTAGEIYTGYGGHMVYLICKKSLV